jgi:hypothetical protein
MKPEQFRGGSLADHRWRARVQLSNPNTSVSDPFAVNPIRRSAGLVAVCLAMLTVPWMISHQVGTTMMLATGWLAITGLVLGLPILIWCSGEWVVERIHRRMHPGIELLELSPRVEHILARHGIVTIREVESIDDAGLLLLSNMDLRGVKEVRRAVNIWKYRRWQESGFTAVGTE